MTSKKNLKSLQTVETIPFAIYKKIRIKPIFANNESLISSALPSSHVNQQHH